MAIPPFREDGWLPQGHHPATWEEIEQMFGAKGTRRGLLLERLIEWRDALQRRGVSGILLLDGSFASAKAIPGDVDALFVFSEESERVLADDAESQDLISHTRIKERGIGDVFCFKDSSVRDFPHMCRLDGFDLDKQTGLPKGLVEVRI